MSKVIIIGAGAAGMMAAIGAATCGHEVHIYEKNEKPGKKIYITGKGRCNITNAADMDTVFKNIVTNKNFMYSSYYALNNVFVISMFEDDFGVPIKVERGERVFPVSDKSSDVINGLVRKLKSLGVSINLNANVKSVVIKDEKAVGITLSDNPKKVIEADNVIVATGGFSYQLTGSTGDGYKIAKDTGHEVTDILPALVPLTVKEDFAKDLQGLALKNVKVTFFSGNKELYSEFGEMLFTHFGVSGPVVLSASSYLTKKISNKENITMKIDLKPALSFEVLDDRILREFSEYINKDFRNCLDKLLPKSLIPVIISLSGINPYKKVNEITKSERKILADILKGLTLTVTGTRGFNEAIITQGGVNVKDINPGTMESKHIKSLFFVGEVLDIDALTGGFNLQIAWSTGYLAGISVT